MKHWQQPGLEPQLLHLKNDNGIRACYMYSEASSILPLSSSWFWHKKVKKQWVRSAAGLMDQIHPLLALNIGVELGQKSSGVAQKLVRFRAEEKLQQGVCDICAHRNKVSGWGKCFNVEVVVWRENWTGLFRGWSSLCSLDAQEARTISDENMFFGQNTDWQGDVSHLKAHIESGSSRLGRYTIIGEDDVDESSRGFTIRRKEHSNNWDSSSNFACSQGLGGSWRPNALIRKGWILIWEESRRGIKREDQCQWLIRLQWCCANRSMEKDVSRGYDG